MSSFSVEVVSLGPMITHPNADSLSIFKIGEYQVIVKTSDWEGKDIGVFIAPETVVSDEPEFAFLEGRKRVRAHKFRGLISEGLLVPAREGWQIGQDVTKELGCSKYQEPVQLSMGGENESNPGWMQDYTDIENWKKYFGVLEEGEEVRVLEKCHGANARLAYHEGRLWVGSHHMVKRLDESNLFWKATMETGVGEKVKQFPSYLWFGEVYGQVRDLRYGTKKGELRIAVFDVAEIVSPFSIRYLDWDKLSNMAEMAGLDTPPIVYCGPYKKELIQTLISGPSLVPGADHMREGIVITPVKERWDHKIGRVILKAINPEYLARKGGSEHH